jgi:truncated hemoglobin YjbI
VEVDVETSFERTTQTSPAFGGLFAVVGYSEDGNRQPTAPSEGATLYERLGKFERIQEIVAAFLMCAENDARINHLLPPSELRRLEWLLIDKISELSGGPPSCFDGIRSAHAAFLITSRDFNVLVEQFEYALDRHAVPEREKSELLSILAPMNPGPINVRHPLQMRGEPGAARLGILFVGQTAGWPDLSSPVNPGEPSLAPSSIS